MAAELVRYGVPVRPVDQSPQPTQTSKALAVGKSDPARVRPEPNVGNVQELIDRRAGGGFRATNPVWLANFRINERKVANYSREFCARPLHGRLSA